MLDRHLPLNLTTYMAKQSVISAFVWAPLASHGKSEQQDNDREHSGRPPKLFEQ
jgi:hypothetical protein